MFLIIYPNPYSETINLINPPIPGINLDDCTIVNIKNAIIQINAFLLFSGFNIPLASCIEATGIVIFHDINHNIIDNNIATGIPTNVSINPIIIKIASTKYNNPYTVSINPYSFNSLLFIDLLEVNNTIRRIIINPVTSAETNKKTFINL